MYFNQYHGAGGARQLEELRAQTRERLDKLNAEIDGIDQRGVQRLQEGNRDALPGLLERRNNLAVSSQRVAAELEEIDGEIARREKQLAEDRAWLEKVANDPVLLAKHSEPADAGARRAANKANQIRRTSMETATTEAPHHVVEARDQARRGIEDLAETIDTRSIDRLDALVDADLSGLDARYIAAVTSREYEAAFATLLRHPQDAQLRMSPAQQEALRVATQADALRSLGLGSQGGSYPVPAALDPTIILSSDGALNPLRSISRVITISSNVWKGVVSEGVTATFSPEAQEASDNSPTLTQPSIFPERCLLFCPFSFEVGQDWPGLSTELARLFADAKDTLEAEKFLTGAGHASNEPEGLLAALDTPDDDTSIVNTAGIGALAIGDVYTLQEALPARFQPRATFVSSLTIANAIWRMVADDEPQPFNDDRTRLLGKPWVEASEMGTTTTANQHVLVYGDFQQFAIVDRIGMSVELVPHLFGSSNRYPTGQRGLVGWYRTSSGVLTENAFRALEIKAS